MHYLQLCKDKMNFTEYIWLLYFYHLYDIYYILPFNQKKKKKRKKTMYYKALRILMFIRH